MKDTQTGITARQRNILRAAEELARRELEHEGSGHDWWHIYRVTQLAKRIAAGEGADPFVCELAALLHDLADEKLVDDPEEGKLRLKAWMLEQGTPADDADHVMEIISTMSYRGGTGTPMTTLEGRVVQDADRLDAIGAIGIARTFVYSGKKGRPMHDPNVPAREAMTAEEYRGGGDTAINHFHEKLLKLKDLMNTGEGRRIAEDRHRFMEAFLDRFGGEWDGLE
ncbi:HD domain-containing protein [Saccharibacillus sp. CPCC 101409]|uniref:HD domain-containing protein n=1 Tax=Saccharibacillus sp. CPCC 101409 TaxID=3058041 RepID=UPI002671F912|nr:HD domain-containing protein [Saccharibacillus sp. CPCC 101409]MDO3410833.1 HD domain-containing protein [Saccharibacillus sp. CPCC 101409]